MREGLAVGGIQRKSHFKSGLMIGAAGLAVAAAGPAYATQYSTSKNDGPKYLPWASVGAQGGDHYTSGQVDLFAPVWQDLDSLLFVRLGVSTQTYQHEVGNFGLGFRTHVARDWVLGVYGSYDASRNVNKNTFTQGSFGAELMSPDWDVRVNGYLAANDKVKDIAGLYELYIHDTKIAILQGQEAAYSGFDGEVGYRIFHTHNVDVRLFAGGYSFTRNDAVASSSGQTFDFPFPDINGYMGRAEVDVYDIDVLGTQSRITLSGKITHDDARGTDGYLGMSVRIPLGWGWGAGGQALDEIDRRMVDPVRSQDNVLTQWQYSKPEPVIIYNGNVRSNPTNTLYYVADDTPGAGSYDDPTSLGDATSRGASNPFIVLTDFGGPITGGATVEPGTTIVGGGGTYNVAGVDTHLVFTHDFAPGSGTPTLYPDTPGGNILTIDGNANISNLNFGGDFGAAIYGHNVDDVVITNVDIDGSGGGLYGVQIVQDMSQDMNLHISDSYIHDLGIDGVDVETSVSDGGTSNQTIELTNSTISAAGTPVATNTSVSGGSTVNQTTVIDPTYIYGGYYGLSIYGYASGGTLNQIVTLDDVHIYGAYYDNLNITAYAKTGGKVDQTINMNNVSASYSYGNGIFISANAGPGGMVTQHGTWTNIATNLNSYAGVGFFAYAYNGTAVQSFAVDGLSSYLNFIGAGMSGTAYSGGSTSYVYQTLNLSHATLAGNYLGFGVIGIAGGEDATVVQNASLSHSDVFYNYTGVVGAAEGIGYGTTLQSLTLSNVNSVYNYYANILLQGLGVGYGLAVQRLDLTGVTANGAYYDENIAVRSKAKYGGHVVQYGTWDQVTSNYGYDDGVEFGALAYTGGSIVQDFYISRLHALYNYDDGVDIYSTAYDISGVYGPATVAQYITLADSKMNHNYFNGLRVNTYAYGGYAATLQYVSVLDTNLTQNKYGIYARGTAVYNASTQQIFYIAGSNMNSNDYDGARFIAAGVYGGFATQTVFATDSQFSGNGRYGLFAGAAAVAGGDAEQGVYVYFSSLDKNASDGLHLETYSVGYSLGYYVYYSHVSQTLIAAYDTMSKNGGNGAYIYNYVNYGGRLNQLLYFFGDDVIRNTYNGILETTIANAYGEVGAIFTTAYSDLYVVGSYVYSNGRATGYSGIYVYGAAIGPTYLIQHIDVAETTSNHNGYVGFGANAYAYGFYSLNIQYVTLAYSYFDDNKAAGAGFLAYQYFGLYSFGAAIQDVTILYSEFDNNGYVGLYASAEAAGTQGRSEQNFQIFGSDFTLNGLYGIDLVRYAHDGTYVPGYSCDTVQGLYGGCAFVRQEVLLVGSRAAGNGSDGIYIYSHASNYGAIYSEGGRPYGTPTLVVYDSSIYLNGGDGVRAVNKVDGYSYLYQFNVFVDSYIGSNAGNGIYSASYVANASSMIQRALMYSYEAPMIVANNGGNGFKSTAEVTDGSYAGIFNQIYTSYISHNGAFGIDAAIAYADGTSLALERNLVFDTYVKYNLDGIGLYSVGPGAVQYSYIGGNTVAYNGFVGVYGQANFGAFQYIGVYTFGNDVHGNGTNYLFNSFGGATQILN